jgi:hypothetical protein
MVDVGKAAAQVAADVRHVEEIRIARQIVRSMIAAGYDCELDDESSFAVDLQVIEEQ